MEKDYLLESGDILRVFRDPAPSSPNELGDLSISVLVYDHRDCYIKPKGFSAKEIYEYLENKSYGGRSYDDYHIFNVEAHIHSGVHLSLADDTEYNYKRWDVSNTGYILISKEQSREEAREWAKIELEQWNQYLSSDIWAFKVLRPINKVIFLKSDLCVIDDNVTTSFKKGEETIDYEEIDSCYGFYGSDIEKNGMLDYIDSKIKK